MHENVILTTTATQPVERGRESKHGAALFKTSMSIPNTNYDLEWKPHSRWSLLEGLVVRMSTWPGPCSSMKASRWRGT
ncbi:hypothetical protein E2C01_003403 [Portunus trituberculatus]|uniref:Uncharacterized protein n=1 Tax=Portunus trituberculatus TaxID=210409 RepID=A0A5B7CTG4_PORTR|nr:hypothetical protein [Portunus trituberculatus]